MSSAVRPGNKLNRWKNCAFVEKEDPAATAKMAPKTARIHRRRERQGRTPPDNAFDDFMRCRFEGQISDATKRLSKGGLAISHGA
jgi:hypothetical protein